MTIAELRLAVEVASADLATHAAWVANPDRAPCPRSVIDKLSACWKRRHDNALAALLAAERETYQRAA